MDNWIQILKLDQISVGSTTLDTRELPEEDCCELAKKVYTESFDKYWGVKNKEDFTHPDNLSYVGPTPHWLDEISCEEFYNDLVELVKKKGGILLAKLGRYPYYGEALEAWEECKNA